MDQHTKLLMRPDDVAALQRLVEATLAARRGQGTGGKPGESGWEGGGGGGGGAGGAGQGGGAAERDPGEGGPAEGGPAEGGAAKPVLKIVLMGDNAIVHRFVGTYVCYHTGHPRQASQVDIRL